MFDPTSRYSNIENATLSVMDKDGTVRQAMVGKSSGTQALDEAAVAVAPKNKFKPGIQNGRPVACWATYRVDFNLESQ